MEAKIHKPVLIVIAGPNGSGKTTITSRVLHHEWLEDSIYINPDNIAQNMFGDWKRLPIFASTYQPIVGGRGLCSVPQGIMPSG